MKRAILFNLVLLLVVLGTPVHAQSCWNSNRGDARLTGTTAARLPSEPALLWTFRAADGFKSSPVVCDGTIVAGSVDGSLYGITSGGKLKWKISTGHGIESAALIRDNRVFIGNLYGKVFALELHTGKTIWTYETEGQIMGAPNYWSNGGSRDSDPSGDIVVIGSYDYYLHGIDAATGQGKWKYETDNFINGTPAISDGLAVFGGCDGLLHKVRVKDGSLKGKQEVATYVAGSAAVDDGMAYIGDYDGKFSCLDIGKSRLEWDFQTTEGQQPFIASPAVSDDRVFIGNRDKYVYCFDRKSGRLLWKRNTRAPVEASAVLTSNGLLVVNLRGDLMILDPETGKVTWTYETGASITGNPAVVNGRIYVAASDGRVYCFGTK